MGEKYLDSNVSQDKTKVVSLVPQPVRPPGFGSELEWQGFKDNVKRAHANGLIPSGVTTPEKALAIALKGRELGLDAMYSLSQIYLVHGKAGLQAEVMRALVYKKYPKAKMQIITPPEKRHLECTIVAAREGGEDQTFSFTIEDAQRAGLVEKSGNGYRGTAGKDTWTKYPQDMLMGRCTSRCVRFLWPECVMGMGYTPEELQEPIQADPEKRRDVEALDADFSVDGPETVQNVQSVQPALTPAPVDLDDAFKQVVKDLPEEEKFPFEKALVPGGKMGHCTTEVDLGAYRMPVGRFTGRCLSEIGPDQLKEYLKTVKGQKPSAVINELASKIEAFLKETING